MQVYNDRIEAESGWNWLVGY